MQVDCQSDWHGKVPNGPGPDTATESPGTGASPFELTVSETAISRGHGGGPFSHAPSPQVVARKTKKLPRMSDLTISQYASKSANAAPF